MLAALLFLSREVLVSDQPWLDDVVRAKRPAHLPTVLTLPEVRRLIDTVADAGSAFVAQLLYGTGMRVLEALRLRIKDVEPSRREIVVRDGKTARIG